MNLPASPSLKIFPCLVLLISSFLLISCSDDDSQNQSDKQASSQGSESAFDHTHDYEVTDIQKHKFEHDFARQCVDREIKNSDNKEEDRKRFEEPCMCIATYMMKDLTTKEAEKFITEHENPRSLQIKFDSAAYHCLQQKALPQGPKLFGRQ